MQSLLDGAEHLIQLKDIDEQLQRVCRETDIGEAQGTLSFDVRKLTLLIIILVHVSRHKELKELMEEFRTPMIRMGKNLEVLRDGLEGKFTSFERTQLRLVLNID